MQNGAGLRRRTAVGAAWEAHRWRARLAAAGGLGLCLLRAGATVPESIRPIEALAGIELLHASGIDGTGEVVGIAATGVDPDHCDLLDPAIVTPPPDGSLAALHRKIAGYWSLPTTADGLECDWDRHGLGTAMGSFAAGRADPALALPTDGIAPAARLAIADVHDEGRDGLWACHLPEDDMAGAMAWLARDCGAVAVAIGCWDNPYLAGGQYTPRSLAADRAAFDHPDLLVVAPSGDVDPLLPAEWAPPATAKNVLVASVAIPHAGGWSEAPRAARSPAGALAPVIHVSGPLWEVAASDADPSTYQCDRSGCSSTGCAAAALAGGAALVSQAYAEGRRAASPRTVDCRRGLKARADLLRAYLFAVAQPSPDGTAVLAARLDSLPGDGTGGPLWFQAPGDNTADHARTFWFQVTAPGPVTAVLVWTDPPHPDQTPELVRDLDLLWHQPPLPVTPPDHSRAWERLVADLPAGEAAIRVAGPATAPCPYALVVAGPVALPPAADWDGDGLANQTEMAERGTDPMLPDTDGDGLGDAVESVPWQALHRDHDADLLPDAWAARYGWEPLPGSRDLPRPARWWTLDELSGASAFDEQTGGAPLQVRPALPAPAILAGGLFGGAIALGGRRSVAIEWAPRAGAIAPWALSMWVRVDQPGRFPLVTLTGEEGSGWMLALSEPPVGLIGTALDSDGRPHPPAATAAAPSLVDGWHQLSLSADLARASEGGGPGRAPLQAVAPGQIAVGLDGELRLEAPLPFAAVAGVRLGPASEAAGQAGDPASARVLVDDLRWYAAALSALEAAAIYDAAFSDPDFDFLLTYDEAALGIDPYAADTDGDGRDDFDEVVQGSDPLVADVTAPPLRISAFSVMVDGTYSLQWRSVPGRRYRIETSADGTDWTLRSPPLTASGQISSWVDSGLPLAARRLFRVIELQ